MTVAVAVIVPEMTPVTVLVMVFVAVLVATVVAMAVATVVTVTTPGREEEVVVSVAVGPWVVVTEVPVASPLAVAVST